MNAMHYVASQVGSRLDAISHPRGAFLRDSLMHLYSGIPMHF